VCQIDAGSKAIIKAPGGTIILDGGGITLKGMVTIKGSLSISGGSPDAIETLNLSAIAGDPVCEDCLRNSKK
jgi:type VI secretion system secreted protein VgrG